MQAKIRGMSAAHASALSALTERLDAASASIANLEEQLETGRGELAEMEARVRSLHRELQVWCNMRLPVLEGQICYMNVLQLQRSQRFLMVSMVIAPSLHPFCGPGYA